MEVDAIYSWLTEQLRTEFEEVRLLKKSSRGSVRLIRHRASGKQFIQGDTQILGTTGFAAPEQYGLGQSNTRTDIYSLGVLMNLMLTGQHPSKKLAEGRMGQVIQRCAQVNPSKRYKDVIHLMEVLS